MPWVAGAILLENVNLQYRWEPINMMIIEKTLEMRGMPREEIITYFISINGKNVCLGKFIGENWEVEVSEESRVKIGSLEIPSTTVVFRSEKENLEQMISKFRLKFLSAGG